MAVASFLALAACAAASDSTPTIDTKRYTVAQSITSLDADTRELCIDSDINLPGGMGCDSIWPVASDPAADKLKHLLCLMPLRDLPAAQSEWTPPPDSVGSVAAICPAACSAHGVGRCKIVPALEPSPGVTNVVFSLIRSHEDESVFIERTKCLVRAMAGGPTFDQIVFHEGTLNTSTVLRLLQNYPGIRFVNAHLFGGFVVPETLESQMEENSIDEGSLGCELARSTHAHLHCPNLTLQPARVLPGRSSHVQLHVKSLVSCARALRICDARR
jgi:hypothetical protein